MIFVDKLPDSDLNIMLKLNVFSNNFIYTIHFIQLSTILHSEKIQILTFLIYEYLAGLMHFKFSVGFEMGESKDVEMSVVKLVLTVFSSSQVYVVVIVDVFRCDWLRKFRKMFS